MLGIIYNVVPFRCLQDRLEDKDATDSKRRKDSPDTPKEAEPKVLCTLVSV